MKEIKSKDDLIEAIGAVLDNTDYISCEKCPVTNLCQAISERNGSYAKTCAIVVRKAFEILDSVYGGVLSIKEEEQC